MKRVLVFLMLLFLPTIVLADWIGSVDKRRYVTQEEKSQFPYHNIVRIETGTGVSTGTIISPNVILTCGHCISYLGLNNNVNFYTTDGRVHTGKVMYFKDSIAEDYGLIYTKDLIPGPFLNVSNITKMENNTMRSGYDTLKVLSNYEVKTVKKAFLQVLSKYKNVTYENFDNAMDDVSNILLTKDCSKSIDKSDCVYCINQSSCIFEDYDKLKVQDSCSIKGVQGIDAGGSLLVTDCALSPGGSGSPLIDSTHKNIIGVSVGTVGFMIGSTPDAVSTAVKPEEFKEKTKYLINMAGLGLIEY